MSEMSVAEGVTRVPEARYSYYRRCQVFPTCGEQCKAPAEKGAHIFGSTPSSAIARAAHPSRRWRICWDRPL
jgi:hypothetical protein